MSGRKILFFLGGLFELLGIGLLAGAAVAYQSSVKFDASAERALGVVVDLEPQRSKSGNTLYRPIVEFADREGRKLRIPAGGASSPPSYQRGDNVTVLYPRGTPEAARLDSWSDRFLATTILGTLGAVFSIVGGGLLVIGLRVRSERARPDLDQQTRVQAKVVSVERGEASFGQRHWTILAQWQDPETGLVHVFESDEIPFDPTDHVQGRSVTVLIDPDDPSVYDVDLSFLPMAG